MKLILHDYQNISFIKELSKKYKNNVFAMLNTLFYQNNLKLISKYFYRFQTKTYSLQLFDNKIDAEEFCKIIDMHTLNIISFSNKKLVHKVSIIIA